MLKQFVVTCLFIFSINFAFAKGPLGPSDNQKLQNMLEKAKLEASRGSYDTALKLLIDYRKSSAKIKKHPMMSLYVIESIGRIYLRIKQDPDAAIKFFSEALNDPSLTDSDFDIIRAWLGRAIEWKNLGLLQKTSRSLINFLS